MVNYTPGTFNLIYNYFRLAFKPFDFLTLAYNLVPNTITRKTAKENAKLSFVLIYSPLELKATRQASIKPTDQRAQKMKKIISDKFMFPLHFELSRCLVLIKACKVVPLCEYLQNYRYNKAG